MKKSTSILLTFAAIAAVPVMAIGCGHEHDYNVLKTGDSQHWYECSCGEKDPKGAEACYDYDGTDGKHDGKCDVCNAPVDFFKSAEVGAYTYKSSAEAENYRALMLNADGTGVYAMISDTTYLFGNDVTCERINEGNFKYQFFDGEDGTVVNFYFAENGTLMLAYGSDPVAAYNKEEDFTMPEPRLPLVTGKYEGSYSDGDVTVTVAFSIYDSLDGGYYTDSLGKDYDGMIAAGYFSYKDFSNPLNPVYFNAGVVANADGTITLTVNGTSFDLNKTGPAEHPAEPDPEEPDPDTDGETYTGHDPNYDLDVTFVINDGWTEAIYTDSDGSRCVLSLTETAEGVYTYNDGTDYMAGTITVNDDGTLTIDDNYGDESYIITKTQE